MTARRTVRKTASAKPAAKPKTGTASAVQEALQVTWLLKGNLKNAQLAYIRVGVLLARVRDDALFTALGHPDMEHYAAERLHLGRASLYRYMQIHDWIRDFHADWLKPKPKGFIPDLNDAADLMFIEKELARKDLAAETRAGLETLRGKALDGSLRKSELNPYRRRQNAGQAGRKAFLSSLRALRNRGKVMASMPAEVISHLDAAIGILQHAGTLSLAGFDEHPASKAQPAA